MSLPKVDVRSKVDPRVVSLLDAEAIASGEDQSAVIREILTEWAREKARFVIQTQRNLAYHGLDGELEGFAGKFARREVPDLDLEVQE